MNYLPDPRVGAALARLEEEAERHVHAVARIAARQLQAPGYWEDALGSVFVSSAIRHGLLLQLGVATALQLVPEYKVWSPAFFLPVETSDSTGALEIDIAAYSIPARQLWLLEVVRNYDNLSSSRKKALKNKLITAAGRAGCWARERQLDPEGLGLAVVSGQLKRPRPDDVCPVISLERFPDLFGITVEGPVRVVLRCFEKGVHEQLSRMEF